MVLGKLQEYVYNSWFNTLTMLMFCDRPKFYSPDPRKIFSGVILCTTDVSVFFACDLIPQLTRGTSLTITITK